MFKDRVFNISFLVSVFWHLFWISIVTIISVPTGASLADYSKVSFLGPILEKTAFELMLEESPLRAETIYMKPVIPQYTFDVDIAKADTGFFKPASEMSEPVMFRSSFLDIIDEDKTTLPYFYKEVYSVSLKKDVARSPLGHRAVAFKPDRLPKIPIWIAQDKESFKIELEFAVSATGAVERVTPVVSSGHPKIDMIGMNYLKGWRFAPLKDSEEKLDQTGRIEIELRVD